ncbi:MAG TPA: hypothetical protein PLU96_07625 [Methanofastidiosum sp.]|jgi:hypothetical protein|nr:hypothetical protein [Methanofastidiosum sp.]
METGQRETERMNLTSNFILKGWPGVSHQEILGSSQKLNKKNSREKDER